MSRDFQPLIDYINSLNDFDCYNNIELTVVRENYAECRIDITPIALNSQGIVHGAMLFALCDVATGYAICCYDRPAVTAGANMEFISPGEGSFLRAVGEPVEVGDKIAIVKSCVYDEASRLVAKGTFTYFFTD